MARLQDFRALAIQQLAAAGIENPLLEIDMLLGKVLQQPRAWLLTHGDEVLDEAQITQLQDYLQRRCTHEPMAYILEEREFYGHSFKVVSGVLVPRPDTETVIEAVKTLFPNQDDLKGFAEVGVGSGAIVVTLLAHYPQATAQGTDVSPQALALARANAAKHGVEPRLILSGASLLEGVQGPLGLVVSNPPYIPTADIKALDKTVQAFEPHLALDGGADGLDLYRKLIPQAYKILRAGGWCVLEHGYNQAAAIDTIFTAAGFKAVVSFKDLGEHTRVTAAQKG